MKEAEHEFTTLQKEIVEYERALKELKEEFPDVHSYKVKNKKEGSIQLHRESCSLWRRIQTPEEEPMDWFEELRDLATEKFEQDRPIRSVIKRMSVIDESIQLYFCFFELQKCLLRIRITDLPLLVLLLTSQQMPMSNYLPK